MTPVPCVKVSPVKDLTGAEFGRWTVLSRAEPKVFNNGTKHSFWHCRCECGTERPVNQYSLTRGDTESCGCLARQLVTTKMTVHGQSKTSLYNAWCSMISRCHNENDSAYLMYGSRGIYVCDQWRNSFQTFQQDMPNRPEDPSEWLSIRPYWTLDRIDNNGPYEPGNVRWASPSQQVRNRRPKAECKRQHKFTPENTYVFPNGRRACRTCRRMHKRGEL